MDVILFASPLNPLSAVAADFFWKEGFLKVLVIPQGLPGGLMKAGPILFFSKLSTGLYRYFHVLLRMAGLKRSKNYSCLLEFMRSHTTVPVIEFYPGMPIEQRLRKELGEVALSNCLIFACVFRYKIPADFVRNRYAVNVHPGILPDNRGPNAYFWALATKQNESGLTFHVLEERIDEGSILMLRTFLIQPRFSEYRLERLSAETLRNCLPYFWANFMKLWENSSPQGKGVYYKEPDYRTRRKYRRLSFLNLADFLE